MIDHIVPHRYDQSYCTTQKGICQMKKSEVKKMQALSIRRDDAVSDENWFLMMRDIFRGYEQARDAEQDKAVFEEACKRG